MMTEFQRGAASGGPRLAARRGGTSPREEAGARFARARETPRNTRKIRYTLNLTETTKPGFGEYVITSPDPYSAAEGAHAIAVVTEWDEFKTLDYQKIYDSMAKPAFLFDGRNIIDAAKCRAIGFQVYSIGKPVGMN